MVTSCNSDAEFLAATSDKNMIYLVDFFAEWCGPCKAIAPYFTQLAAEYKEITFLKVDIEKCENTAAR